jgi:raffinose/stachyose/melibiose transport system substrate-binding protein
MVAERFMKYPLPFSLASLESPSGSASVETVVKILHPNAISELLEIWQAAAVEYEEAHPAVKVRFDYLENEEFKAKLPMLLQSSDRPSAFHSWGGGVVLEHIRAGVCQDITNAIAGNFKDSFYPTGVQAFMSQGQSYGLPDSIGPIVFWYDKELARLRSGGLEAPPRPQNDRSYEARRRRRSTQLFARRGATSDRRL